MDPMLTFSGMPDRTKDEEIAQMAAVLRHLSELDHRTRTMILALEDERDREAASGDAEKWRMPDPD
jgi:hypothetical protein